MMILLNALLYLLLILIGSTVAWVLADLNKAEETALQALTRLEAQSAESCPPVRLPARSSGRPVRRVHCVRRTPAGQTISARALPVSVRADAVRRPSHAEACLRPVVIPTGFLLPDLPDQAERLNRAEAPVVNAELDCCA